MPILIKRRLLAKLIDELLHAEYYAQRYPRQPEITVMDAGSLPPEELLRLVRENITAQRITDAPEGQEVLTDTPRSLQPYGRVPHIVAESLEALGPLPDNIRNFQVTDSNLQQAIALADTLEEPEVYSVTVRFEHEQFPTAHYFIDLSKLTALNDEKYKQAIQLAAAHPRQAANMQGSLAQTGTFGVSNAAKVVPPCAVVGAVTIWARDSRSAR